MKEPEKEARRWLLQADDDFRFVQWIADEGVFFDKGCFMSQQAGEKILKACLYAMGKRVVLGYSLFEMLLELAEQNADFEIIKSESKRLDRFYIPARYPNGLPGGTPFQIYSRQELNEARKDLKKVFDIAKAFLEKRGIT